MNKKNRNFLKAGITIFVALALFIPVTAFANDDETSTFEIKRTGHGIDLAGMDIAIVKTKELITSCDEPLPLDPVLEGYHPAVASDLLGNVVLGFEDESPNVWFTASLDGGQTWLPNAAGWQIPEPPELPDVDSCGDGRFIGGMVPHPDAFYGSELYKVTVLDPGDISPSGYKCGSWRWWDVGDGYTNFDSIAVAGYTAVDPAENTWAYGGHAITGDHGGDSGDDTIFFSYQFQEAQGYAWIYRWAGANGAEDCAHDIDPDDLYSYAAWNFDNEGTLDIYVSIIDFGTWVPVPPSYQQHPDVDDLVIETSGNDTYIDISALNDNIIIVSERDGNAVAYYSTNGMSSVSEAFIATGTSNPRIVHTGDNEATCIFVRGGRGTVYYSVTENGGATWSTPEELTTDPVAEDFQRADVCGFGTAYESDDTIYFEPRVGGGDPILDITSVSGGLGVKATVKNIGTANATNVSWTITVTGGILGFINVNKSGVIPTLAVDAESVLKTGIFFGLGKIVIEVTATCDEGSSATETETGMQIIIFTKIS